LWQRIAVKSDDPLRPIDRMYVEYARDQFKGLNIDEAVEPELTEFVKSIQSGLRKYNDYPAEQLEYFAQRIYELRKDNTDNAA
jgi:hypothetical protein